MKKVVTKYYSNDGGHYVPGVISGGMLYVSGQLSINPETGMIPEGGVKSEVKQALENLNDVLIAAGTSRERVVSCRVYIPDVALWPELNEAYAEFFGDHKPSRVVVPSNNLYGGCKVEIEAIAEVGE